MKKLLFIFFIITLRNIYLANEIEETPKEGIDYPGIRCGKKNPKKPKDCSKYGTDSDMYCCWTNTDRYSKVGGECQLLSKKMAEKKKIYGTKDFSIGSEKKFWDCGNKSFYLNIRYKTFFLFFIFYNNLLL